MPFENLEDKLNQMGIQEEPLPDISPGHCFSGHEIVLLATEIEKEGHIFYRYAEKISPSKKVAQIFHMMAEDELEHIKVLHKEIAPIFKKDGTYWESDEHVAYYIANILNPKIFSHRDSLNKKMEEMKDETSAIKLCLEGEKKAVEFYEKVLKLTKCSDGQEAIEKILQQEKEHVAKLQKMQEEIKQ